jgi:pimeloyl-ACP methyl ester carboxylesterase
MQFIKSGLNMAAVLAALVMVGTVIGTVTPSHASATVKYRTVTIDGVEIFYREAGDPSKPTLLLLHGFPTSSHMFRNLMADLGDSFHLVAPDYPGFGFSAMPSVDEFEYTFDNLANVMASFIDELELKRYSIYLMDYGAPVGFRIATRWPERVEGLIIQNGNAYDEGLLEFWDPIKAYWDHRSEENAEALRGFLTLDVTKWQFTNGVRVPVIRKSSYSCSTATGRTRRCIPSGRSICAHTSRRR